MSRLFVIGDIHGRLDRLDSILQQIQLTLEDEMVFLGDYIDRGDNTWGVLKRLYALAGQYPGLTFLQGNHEEMLFDRFAAQPHLSPLEVLLACKAAEEPFWCSHAIAELQEAACTEPELLQKILAWLSQLPCFYETRGIRFSHGGCNLQKPLDQQEGSDFLWSRADFYEHYQGEQAWIIGHTPVQRVFPEDESPQPAFLDNRVILLDTGAYKKDGRLSCLELTEMVLYQA